MNPTTPVRKFRGKQKAPTKVPISIRLDPTVLDAWRSTGKGWQTRLAKAITKHAPRVTVATVAPLASQDATGRN